MAQKSIFWTTGSGGDGAAAYTQAEIIRWQRQQWIRNNATDSVHKNYAQELAVTTPGSASPFNVATGAGMVYGFPYWNTSNYTASIPTPATGTRYDRIVLQADWSSTSVRIARLGGVAGGTQASLTQTDGVKWEVPLARIACTTNGTFTVTDKRRFLRPNVLIDYTSFTSAQGPSVLAVGQGTASYGNERATVDNRVLARKSAKLAWTQIDYLMAGDGIAQLYRHQGGSSSNWITAGATDYTAATVLNQVGIWNHPGTSARVDAIYTSVVFPVRFSGPPLVFPAVYNESDPYGVVVSVKSSTRGGASFGFYASYTAPITGFDVAWQAIGPG